MLGPCFELCQFVIDLFKFTIPNRSTALKVKQNTQNPLQSLVRTNAQGMVSFQSAFICKERILPETEQ